MKSNKPSRRAELAAFAANGSLRQVMEMRSYMSHEAIDLLVDITLRYCTSTSRRRKKPTA